MNQFKMSLLCFLPTVYQWGGAMCHRTNRPAAHLNALQGNNLTGSVQTDHIQRTPENTDRDRAPGSGKRG